MSDFNVNSWSDIEPFLPEDEDVKSVVLNDFIWFMNREEKYRGDIAKIHDYIHHLKIKKENMFNLRGTHNELFKDVDVTKIEAVLLLNYDSNKR